MRSTVRLFDSDSYIKEFSARVAGYSEQKGERLVALDQTAFFPEGGGQFADCGEIDGAVVTDAHERDGVIWHRVDREFETGQQVSARIDWARRFDFMQQHSGEHIFSGIANRLYGCNNVGFHLGLESTTIDFDVQLSPEEIAELERLANEAVYDNIPVRVEFPDPEQLSGMAYRSKKELSGRIRIVTVEGCDVCACCGTHVAATGEIGIIKIISSQNYKGGTRLQMLCGARALKDYQAKNAMMNFCAAALSTKPELLAKAQGHLEDELAAQKLRAAAMERELLALRAEKLGRGEFKAVFERGMTSDELRRWSLALAENFGVAAAFSGAEGEWKYAFASAREDVRELAKRFNAACAGRGGGKPELVQGNCAASREKIEAFFGSLQ